MVGRFFFPKYVGPGSFFVSAVTQTVSRGKCQPWSGRDLKKLGYHGLKQVKWKRRMLLYMKLYHIQAEKEGGFTIIESHFHRALLGLLLQAAILTCSW